MTTALSRMFSPGPLLYLFVVITQFAYGVYLGAQLELPPAVALLYWLGFLWAVGWWLRTDSHKRGVAPIYDLGFFLYIAWPLVLPYYLVKTRGARGLPLILGFIAAYVGAAILGIILSVFVITLRSWKPRRCSTNRWTGVPTCRDVSQLDSPARYRRRFLT